MSPAVLQVACPGVMQALTLNLAPLQHGVLEVAHCGRLIRLKACHLHCVKHTTGMMLAHSAAIRCCRL